MKQTVTTGLVVGTMALAGTVTGAGVASAELPPKSITHHNSQYWSWAGPRDWVSADGAYGIQIFGDNDRSIDYGFSSIVCANGANATQSVTNYFAGRAAELRTSVRSQWRKGKVRSSRISQLPVSGYGQLYFRQSFRIKGKDGAKRMKGEVQYDYSLASGPLYCFARSESRIAPARGYGRSIRQLRSVQNSMAYFGPGVAGGGGNTDPDQ
ncbi:MAG: hypothetical protein U0R64_02370 [Candidatus Nanopelagicales bacterium]